MTEEPNKCTVYLYYFTAFKESYVKVNIVGAFRLFLLNISRVENVMERNLVP